MNLELLDRTCIHLITYILFDTCGVDSYTHKYIYICIFVIYAYIVYIYIIIYVYIVFVYVNKAIYT